MIERRAIIWDWNGTLLDDLDICILGINQYLRDRHLKELDRKLYREVFDFPIQKYYSRIGFDFDQESFEALSVQFLDTYFKNFHRSQLFYYAVEVLEYFKQKNYRQFILSAMERRDLKNSVAYFDITHYFESITGSEDILAQGKAEYARLLMKNFNLHVSSTCLVGDTLHDQEVADRLKIPCILVAAGHQNFERLNVNHNHVVRNLEEARKAIESVF